MSGGRGGGGGGGGGGRERGKSYSFFCVHSINVSVLFTVSRAGTHSENQHSAVLFQNSVHIWSVFVQTLLLSYMTDQQHTQLGSRAGREREGKPRLKPRVKNNKAGFLKQGFCGEEKERGGNQVSFIIKFLSPRHNKVGRKRGEGKGRN